MAADLAADPASRQRRCNCRSSHPKRYLSRYKQNKIISFIVGCANKRTANQPVSLGVRLCESLKINRYTILRCWVHSHPTLKIRHSRLKMEYRLFVSPLPFRELWAVRQTTRMAAVLGGLQEGQGGAAGGLQVGQGAAGAADAVADQAAAAGVGAAAVLVTAGVVAVDVGVADWPAVVQLAVGVRGTGVEVAGCVELVRGDLMPGTAGTVASCTWRQRQRGTSLALNTRAKITPSTSPAFKPTQNHILMNLSLKTL